MNAIIEEVKQDMIELQKLDGTSAERLSKALAYVDSHQEEIIGYRDSMKISEISDLVFELVDEGCA